MAQPTLELITALRDTAARLKAGGEYQWGHMGVCNCGHLAQTITALPKHAIHQWALERVGDWEAQAHQYCPASGYRIDDVIAAMLALGMTRRDIGNLERLSDREVLARLPEGERRVARNRRDDVIRYLVAWADLLEEALPAARAAKAA